MDCCLTHWTGGYAAIPVGFPFFFEGRLYAAETTLSLLLVKQIRAPIATFRIKFEYRGTRCALSSLSG